VRQGCGGITACPLRRQLMNWETGLWGDHCLSSEGTVDELGDRDEVGPLLVL